MRESLQCWRGHWRLNRPKHERRTRPSSSYRHEPTFGTLILQVIRFGIALFAAVLLVPAALFAQQSPWERAATNLEQTFTGPLARSLALVAIVIGGLMFMFGEAGAKRQISGIVFGGGLALFAAQFLTWLF
jgi:type IV secretory pathway VirB2 component (pilin)